MIRIQNLLVLIFGIKGKKIQSKFNKTKVRNEDHRTINVIMLNTI